MSSNDRLRCDVPHDWYDDPSQCLNEWQGIEGAALALLAALIGARWLRRQIKQTEDHRNDELARRHNASRIALPLALAAVHSVVQSSADDIAGELEQHGSEGFDAAFEAAVRDGEFRKRFSPIAIDEKILTAFQSFVETLKIDKDVRHVAELISSIQIFIARFNDFDLRQAGRQISLESLLMDAAKVLLLNDSIYNYARFVDNGEFGIVGSMSVDAAWDAVRRKAHSLVFFRDMPDALFPGIDETIARYKESKISPWNEKFAE